MAIQGNVKAGGEVERRRAESVSDEYAHHRSGIALLRATRESKVTNSQANSPPRLSIVPLPRSRKIEDVDRIGEDRRYRNEIGNASLLFVVGSSGRSDVEAGTSDKDC